MNALNKQARVLYIVSLFYLYKLLSVMLTESGGLFTRVGFGLTRNKTRLWRLEVLRHWEYDLLLKYFTPLYK